MSEKVSFKVNEQTDVFFSLEPVGGNQSRFTIQTVDSEEDVVGVLSFLLTDQQKQKLIDFLDRN